MGLTQKASRGRLLHQMLKAVKSVRTQRQQRRVTTGNTIQVSFYETYVCMRFLTLFFTGGVSPLPSLRLFFITDFLICHSFLDFRYIGFLARKGQRHKNGGKGRDAGQGRTVIQSSQYFKTPALNLA